MNPVDRYIDEVLHNIQALPRERQRIAADLRAHLEEAVAAGEPVEAVIARMGTPAEVAMECMSPGTLPYASFWRRLGACAIDLFIVMAAGGSLVAVAALLSNLVPREPQGADYVLGALLIAAVIACALATVGIIVLYFPILEARFGQTVGKRLLGLRVLRESGLPIGYKEAFLRRLSFYFDIFAVDALFIPFTARHQRAFDIVARTIVIRELTDS